MITALPFAQAQTSRYSCTINIITRCLQWRLVEKRGINDRGTEHTATDPSAPTGTPGNVAGRDPRMVNAASNRQLIGEALAQLPAEQLAVVRRSYYQAWTTAQIADDLHIAEDTVKSRLHYALQALLPTLQGNGLTR